MFGKRTPYDARSNTPGSDGLSLRKGRDSNPRKLDIPAFLCCCDALGTRRADSWHAVIADERELMVSRKPGQQQLPKRLLAFRGRLPDDFTFDRS